MNVPLIIWKLVDVPLVIWKLVDVSLVLVQFIQIGESSWSNTQVRVPTL